MSKSDPWHQDEPTKGSSIRQLQFCQGGFFSLRNATQKKQFRESFRKILRLEIENRMKFHAEFLV